MRTRLLLLSLLLHVVPSTDSPSALCLAPLRTGPSGEILMRRASRSRPPAPSPSRKGPSGEIVVLRPVFAQGQAVVAHVHFTNVTSDTIDILEGSPYFSPWPDWPNDQNGITFIGEHASSPRNRPSPDPNVPNEHRSITLSPGQQCEIPVILQSYCGSFPPGHRRIAYAMAVPYFPRAELEWPERNPTSRDGTALVSYRRIPLQIRAPGELKFEVR